MRLLIILGWSLASSFATAFAFAISTSGKISVSTLCLPGVATIATIFGGVAGVVLCPYMYWCLKGRNQIDIVLTLILVAIVLVSVITVASPRVGLIASFVYWALALFTVRIWVSGSGQ